MIYIFFYDCCYYPHTSRYSGVSRMGDFLWLGFTEFSLGRFSLWFAMSVEKRCMSYHLLLPFMKVQCQNINYKQIPYIQCMKGTWSKNLHFRLRNHLKSQTILICIVVKLAGKCPWLLAILTCDMWQVTSDTWQVTCDIWHFFLVSLLISAHIERFSVSRMWVWFL